MKNDLHIQWRTNYQPFSAKVPKLTKVVFGGFSGMVATTICHPLDLVKIRMQVNETHSPISKVVRNIISLEGYRAMYIGLSAGVLRQATYTTTRLATYYWLYDNFNRKHINPPTISDKIQIGIYAGILGAFAGTPSEVALVRMMADVPTRACTTCPLQRRYRNVIHALTSIYREEGLFSLWRGAVPTVSRSIFVSFAQIGTYIRIRDILIEKQYRGRQLHAMTAVVSSFLTAILSLPFDVIKNKVQVTRTEITQREILSNILKNEGVSQLWKGFIPYYIRIAIHTVISYIILEDLNQLYVLYYDRQNNK